MAKTLWYIKDSSPPEVIKDSSGRLLLCETCPCDIVVGCCGNNFPAILNCAVSGFGTCGGEDIRLAYNASSTKWEGSHTYNDTGGPTTLSVTFACVSPASGPSNLKLTYTLSADCDSAGEWVGQLPTQQCSPLNCHYVELEDPYGCDSCAGNGIDFVVTEVS